MKENTALNLELNLDLELNDMIEKNTNEAWDAQRKLREGKDAEWADETTDNKFNSDS